VDDEEKTDRRPCLFLTFSNSKFTGGTMMIAPRAEIDDGLIEFGRWGQSGRVGLVRNLVRHLMASPNPVIQKHSYSPSVHRVPPWAVPPTAST
jgi:diacylglycerol kinase family enzyme